MAPLPFGVLLGLTVAGVAALGFARTGGWLVWGAVATCAATPLLFYVSSRYRLPLAATLAIPAGIGVSALLRPGTPRWSRAVALAAVAAALSFFVPTQALARSCLASGLSNRAVAWMAAGDLGRASADVERALELDPSAAATWFNAGVVAERRGDLGGAERAYRQALAREPASADTAGNLGGLLVRTGRAQEATTVLERGIAADPGHRTCWTNLVVALLQAGHVAEARAAVARAAAVGVHLDAGLLAAAGVS